MSEVRDSLAQIVKAEPKRYSQAELGRIFGVSRQRVHEIVKVPDLRHLVRPKQWSFYCLDCGKPIHHGAIRCQQCWLKIYGAKRVTLSCDFCGQQFERRESEARRHRLHFCSRSCRYDYAATFGGRKTTVQTIKASGLSPKSARLAKVPKVAPPEFETLEVGLGSRDGLKLRTRVFELYNRDYSSLVVLAQAMGISISQIYRVRYGKRNINEKFIIGAIKAFPGHKLDDLFYVVPDGSDDDRS